MESGLCPELWTTHINTGMSPGYLAYANLVLFSKTSAHHLTQKTRDHLKAFLFYPNQMQVGQRLLSLPLTAALLPHLSVPP
jgi:hypothetical protein